MNFDRKKTTQFDWPLFILVILVTAIGVLNLYSTSHTVPLTKGSSPYIKQMYWIVIGLFVMVVAASVDYHIIVRYGYVVYGLSLLFLAIVFLNGKIAHGSQRWLTLWIFSFQPSELAKLTVIVVLAKYISEKKISETFGIRDLAVPFFLVLIPFVFVVTQPDLGTAMFLWIIFFSIVLFIGIRKKTFVTLATLGGACVPAGWFFLKDYQRQRIMTFLNPERDPLGSGYHIIQSMIAVGSGGLRGKGLMQGTQTQLKFLPEQQTDFVFSVFAEEWGFIGVVILLTLFLMMILWGVKIARQSRDMSGMIIAYGVTAYIFWGVLINIGMVIGVFPVVGIPLPFFSYGGSSMVVLMMGIGLLMNVSMRRFMFQP